MNRGMPPGLLASVAMGLLLAGPALAGPGLPQREPAMSQTPARAGGEGLEGAEASAPRKAEQAPPAQADLEILRPLIEAYRRGDLKDGDGLKSRLSDPAAVSVAEWLAVRSGRAGFDRTAAFLREHEDWPIAISLRRRAEELLLASRKPAAEVRAFFSAQPPVSGPGRLALATALKAEGLEADAAPIIRQSWRDDSFPASTERQILKLFSGVLTAADHHARMEGLLLRGSWAAAMRAASLAGPDHVLLAKARTAVMRKARNAEAALAAVPATRRSDPSYIFSRAVFLRSKDKLAEAAQVMTEAPRDPASLVDGDAWWNERRLLTRKLLDSGASRLAYRVASQHGAEANAQRIEAEFHAGWIALRFLNDAALAAPHFAAAARIAATPISVARAAYWEGRAAEAAGDAAEARRHYERAATKPITYYGQLARAKLGQATVQLRAPSAADEAARRAWQELKPVRGLKLLYALGAGDLVLALSADLAQQLDDAVHLDALATMAAEHGNARAVLAVGKTAVQRGFPLDLHAYPTAGIPDYQPVGDEVETAMVYAIARQESAFNPRALSSAGARGLMQLMPATAKRTAKRFGVGFDAKRLLEDPAYNATIGSAHLGELLEDWKGSHILAFASYNAGGGNVRKWINAYGDPRLPHIDTVDWIERIPFYETRNYVQRVLENLEVYRHRLNNPAGSGAGRIPDQTGEARFE